MLDSGIVEQVRRTQALEVRGDREGARAIYGELWEDATRADDLYRACIAAHFMAHAHDAAMEQVEWHLRALRAAEVAEAAGDRRVRPFYPSLHANLADVYLRLGDWVQARAHVAKAREAQYMLQDDAYGHTVRALIARLALEVERG